MVLLATAIWPITQYHYISLKSIRPNKTEIKIIAEKKVVYISSRAQTFSLHYPVTTPPMPIVSQPSKCLKFMTFREGCFFIRNSMQVLKSSSSEFLSLLILQKMKKDNISQIGDYDAPICKQQYTHGSCYISLFKFKSLINLIPHKLPQILDIYSIVAL